MEKSSVLGITLPILRLVIFTLVHPTFTMPTRVGRAVTRSVPTSLSSSTFLVTNYWLLYPKRFRAVGCIFSGISIGGDETGVHVRSMLRGTMICSYIDGSRAVVV